MPIGETLGMPKLCFSLSKRELSLPHCAEGVPPSRGLDEPSFEPTFVGAFIQLSRQSENVERSPKGQKVEIGKPSPKIGERLLSSALWPAQDTLSLLERNNPVEVRKLTQKGLFRNSGKGFCVQLGVRPYSELNPR
jgi:hypothetical protein